MLKNLAPETCVKNLKQVHATFCTTVQKPAQQTRLTVNTVVDASPKHSRPFKPRNFGHVNASFSCRIELHSIRCKQIRNTCAKEHVHMLNKLVQISGSSFLSVCHP